MAQTTIPAFQPRSDVHLGSLNLNDYDANGVAWVVEDIKGWWELPPAQIPDDPRPYFQDGSYLVAGRYGPRGLTIKGFLIPTPNAELAAADARVTMARQLDLVRQTTLLVVDEDVPKQAWVQLVGFDLTSTTPNGTIGFTIQLKAPDPRKYAKYESAGTTMLFSASGGREYPRTYPVTYGVSGASGVITVNNKGTYITNAQLRIYGPIADPEIEHLETGSKLQFSGVIQATEYYDLDLFDRTVLLNGTTSRREMLATRSQWFVINPGMNHIRFNGSTFDTSLTPSLTVNYRSAWIY